ncbi:signal peptide containing protein [Theileria equi strain WA]|uniref:Signal peptide containing protein n=1 Tax=Theileria equi strain WA TaxID=1537102 RepID=L1LFG5_THEEQ|nr:signal peptide containing protein [Theileria equi strain WA]EKX73995.1 signal peptide containing protein [Theileria equi strain WA]|eukprot:XP_004833447.1 signal peptide containing protein [Theileria equi strain WA]
MNCTLRLATLLTILFTVQGTLGDYGNLHFETEDIKPIIEIDDDIEEIEDDAPKTPIALDISREIPTMITTTNIPGTLYYIVEPEYYDTHRIGEVKDDGETLSQDHEMNIERIVSTYAKGDGTKLVRIKDFYPKDDGNLALELVELVKKPGSINYVPLVRHPVEVDVLTQESTSTVRVQGNLRSQKIYRVVAKMKDDAYIGVVKYGGEIVHEALSNDILARNVTFNVLKQPTILVKTYMKNGVCIHSKYQSSDYNRRFELVHEETRSYT